MHLLSSKNLCYSLTLAGGFGDKYWYWVKLVINALVPSLRGLKAGESVSRIGESVSRIRDCRWVLVPQQSSGERRKKSGREKETARNRDSWVADKMDLLRNSDCQNACTPVKKSI